MSEVYQRKLDYLEAAINRGNQISGDCNVCIIVRLETETDVNVQIFADSVKHTIQVNPNLRARIVQTYAPTESDLDLYELRYIDEIGPGYFEYRRIFGEWANQYAEDEMHKRMVPGIETLQFRCVLIESNQSVFHLLLIYNHAVADGISGVILTNQILGNYTKLKKNETLDLTCTRVKTIAELKSDEMPNGDENIQKLTEYANKENEEFDDYLAGCTFDSKEKESFIIKQGSEANLQKLKLIAKRENVTIGMVLLGACHWAFAKINPSRTPIMNIDVNLRGRFTSNSNNYENVGLLIGMCSVAEAASQFDFKNGNVSFWEFCRAMKKSAITSLDQGNHFAFHKVTENRDRSNSPDMKDMNFSSIGHYPYNTKYGDLEMKGMWTVGNGWCPFFGSMIFLAQSLSMQNYSIVFKNEKANKKIADNFLNIVMAICENDLLSSEDLIFNQWVAQEST